MAEKSDRPAYDVFVVDGDGKDAFWTKVGGAWRHEDGKGLNIQLVAMSFTGRLALREPREREPEPNDTKRKKAGG